MTNVCVFVYQPTILKNLLNQKPTTFFGGRGRGGILIHTEKNKNNFTVVSSTLNTKQITM